MLLTMDTRTIQDHRKVAVLDRIRLRVAVLVDLHWGADSGGHVRCWERLAEAACEFGDALDLTVYFTGAAPACRRLSDTVRYRIEAPIFSTSRLGFLAHLPDHTDLAPRHPRLARELLSYDLIHTTDAYFAYARTAAAVARRAGIPLVNSVHTNTPEYARLFTAETVERLFGRGAAARFLVERLLVAERVERRMRRQLAGHQRRCAFALVSRPNQLAAVHGMLGGRAGLLRRGIDRVAFHPARRDRAWLMADYGIPQGRFIVLAAGRLNRCKNVQLVAEAIELLVGRGVDAHLICAGDGDERRRIAARLGPRATCPGVVEPQELARLYAAADLFALPSRIEESSNVLFEALASGLPVLVARESGMGRAVRDGITGLVLPGDDASPWADAVAGLAANHRRRNAMADAARDYAESALPTWREVLAEDLLPIWEGAARQSSRAAA
jgi:glycosyltransferase involved in cell wall biosynthesis